ncbi:MULTISPECIES: peptidoglycan-binding protein [Okeania]|uniref:Peptidoglycan-binding protein n=1 Tax=Okeania hirsuta TaxID=1458930 RepID=A0A3N6P9M1_9CYAN|nr:MULTISPECIES: peptidoglycan-binding protein [Okeania]NES79854.1 peptidoglycan-binding protein [Okeania sp. SIO1H4]NES92462.1 peptidoglycan-binding protein [Okeania sp. SIO2B9]NET23528.1 peptidoglycan-binding protein [Okeania sp. SIO1H5]NET76006.1 peptidoglycan-binding protein [Okeania sp. SIO1F9]NET97380.1 peptidoglycan-binding protein [Okeania sp. SIO1H2]
MLAGTQTTTTRATLTLGSTGEDVKYLQTVLNAIVANNSLVVDGIFGNLTKEAVIAFQKRYGLTADGIVGPQTWGLIDTGKIARATLYFGSTGEDVEYLQIWLKAAGFRSLVVDGIFGVATEEAVKNFQKSSGLTVDGIVGPQTWAKLESINV